jgi:single-strand DNA-binding protein
MNKVILIGNLTKDPDTSTTNSGVMVSRFTIAVQRRFENADGEREADFINIVAWRKLAELCQQYITKGSKVAVEGRLTTRNYEADDGTKRYVTEIMAESIEFLILKKEEEKEEKPKKESKKSKSKADKAELTPIEDDDSLPF